MPFNGSDFIRHVAERLILEFEFSRGAGTPGLIGAAKEHPARVQLQALMPGGVGVGSGIVVDSYGQVSQQQDIVIYEKLCPVFTHNDAAEATYFPIEGVIAVGEVKSGLGKKELSAAVKNCNSVKALRRHAIASDHGLGFPAISFRNYGSTVEFAGALEEQFDQRHKSLDQVYSFILCQRFLASPQTMLDNFAQECREVGIPRAPNSVVSLNDGLFLPFNTKSGSTTRAMMEADGALFSQDPIGGFAELMKMLRIYVVSGRTVERKHYERYFEVVGEDDRAFRIDASVIF